MKLISLSGGHHARVDDQDHEMLSHFRWTCGCGYAYRSVGDRESQHMVKMERTLMLPGPGELVDHINGDTLDNRRCNLRVCTQKENCWNKAARAGSIRGYKGVSRKAGRTRVRARIAGRHLGHFLDPVDAALAYDLAAIESFGEYARLNFLTSGPMF